MPSAKFAVATLGSRALIHTQTQARNATMKRLPWIFWWKLWCHSVPIYSANFFFVFFFRWKFRFKTSIDRYCVQLKIMNIISLERLPSGQRLIFVWRVLGNLTSSICLLVVQWRSLNDFAISINFYFESNTHLSIGRVYLIEWYTQWSWSLVIVPLAFRFFHFLRIRPKRRQRRRRGCVRPCTHFWPRF